MRLPNLLNVGPRAGVESGLPALRETSLTRQVEVNWPSYALCTLPTKRGMFTCVKDRTGALVAQLIS